MTAAESLSTGLADHRVAIAAMLFNAGGIVGYASWGFLADAIGRRKAFLVSFVVSGRQRGVDLFPFDRSYTDIPDRHAALGFGLFGALSGTFIYAPELFPPSVRATALAVCNSVGRYVTAARPAGRRCHRRRPGSAATSAWPPRWWPPRAHRRRRPGLRS